MCVLKLTQACLIAGGISTGPQASKAMIKPVAVKSGPKSTARAPPAGLNVAAKPFAAAPKPADTATAAGPKPSARAALIGPKTSGSVVSAGLNTAAQPYSAVPEPAGRAPATGLNTVARPFQAASKPSDQAVPAGPKPLAGAVPAGPKPAGTALASGVSTAGRASTAGLNARATPFAAAVSPSGRVVSAGFNPQAKAYVPQAPKETKMAVAKMQCRPDGVSAGDQSSTCWAVRPTCNDVLPLCAADALDAAPSLNFHCIQEAPTLTCPHVRKKQDDMQTHEIRFIGAHLASMAVHRCCIDSFGPCTHHCNTHAHKTGNMLFLKLLIVC